MSVTRLNQLEACPRRWALGAADYPEIWSRHGYPRRLSRPAFRGLVLHRVIELIIEAQNGHPEQRFVPLMRSLGGYSRLVSQAIEEVLATYVSNPRVARDLETLRSWASEQAQDWRARSQQFVVSLGLASARGASAASDVRAPAHAGEVAALQAGTLAGIWTEVDLRPPSLNWYGRVDLLRIEEDRCEIVDIKSGQPSDEHAFQVQVYALLWAGDSDVNPDGRLATHLTLAYPGRDVAVTVPTRAELGALALEIERREKVARADAASIPPVARPSASACNWCDVRQLCDTYWRSDTRASLIVANSGDASPANPSFDDVQVAITQRRGESSWSGRVEVASWLTEGDPVIIDCRPNDQVARVVLDAGGSVRLLGVHIRSTATRDEPIVLAVSHVSEVFSC